MMLNAIKQVMNLSAAGINQHFDMKFVEITRALKRPNHQMCADQKGLKIHGRMSNTVKPHQRRQDQNRGL